MEAITAAASRLLAPWMDLYASSVAIETGVMLLHIGGLVVAGGLAFALDRSVLRASGPGALDQRLADELAGSHAVVLTGLGAVLASGVALVAADPEVFLPSTIFWIKMGIVVVLLANGWTVKQAGQALSAQPDSPLVHRRLRWAALRSLGLWAVAVLFGIVLMEVA